MNLTILGIRTRLQDTSAMLVSRQARPADGPSAQTIYHFLDACPSRSVLASSGQAASQKRSSLCLVLFLLDQVRSDWYSSRKHSGSGGDVRLPFVPLNRPQRHVFFFCRDSARRMPAPIPTLPESGPPLTKCDRPLFWSTAGLGDDLEFKTSNAR